MGYVIAAYVLVIGGLAGYGLWIQSQRRAHLRRAGERGASPPGGEEPGEPTGG